MAEVSQNIFKEFKEHSIAEFFKKNRQMLGYGGKIKSLTTAVHEYVTNGVDACEESGILPELFVQLERKGPEHYTLTVEDNGPGIPRKIVGKAFGTMLAGTKFHRFRQARGQQGIGGSGVVMFGQVTTGKPTKIITGRGDDKIYECRLSIDVKTNQPKVTDEKEYAGSMRGTRIETDLKTVKYQKGEYSPDEYLRRTALANPHCKITYIDPEGQTNVYDRAVSIIPKIPKETRPHPKGVEVDDLINYSTRTKARTIKSFLVTEFTRMSNAKANEIQKGVSFDMNKRPRDMTWEEAEEIVGAIRDTSFIAPPTECLIPISEEHLKRALDNVLHPEFETILTRPAALYRGGVPFIVEVGLAYGGKAGKNNNTEGAEKMEVMRFANRVPLLFDTGSCAITKAVQTTDWKRYSIKSDVPITVLVNFTSIYVPYTGAGKEAVTDDEEIIKEIRLTLMDTARRLGTYVSGQRRQYEKEMKKKSFEKYVGEIAKSVSKLTGKSEKLLEKHLNNIVEEKYAEIAEEEENEAEEVLSTEENGNNVSAEKTENVETEVEEKESEE
jgi:DNA topoisomerase-6 subunit B